MHGWDVALALELLAVILGFMLWFKAARAEGGPKKLAKVVAIIIIILSVLLAVCTVTRAFLYAGSEKAAMMGGWGYGMTHGGHMAGAGEGWQCPRCGAKFGKGYGPGMGMMGVMPCPRAEEAPPAEGAEEEPKTE
jgi:hypothetical protein